MKIFRDPIHGDIFASDSDIQLIDTVPIQRLRGIAQLGTVQWVFPGASYNRFEHIIGVLHVTKRIARSLFETPDYRELVNRLSAAAIFHDAGHPPFSHTLEEFGVITKKHEEVSAKIAKETIEGKSGIGISGKEVADIIRRKSKPRSLSGIIAGTLDADRLDYLNRDAHHTGVSYGVIDSRIMSLFDQVEDELTIDERAIVPAETVLFARYVMRAIVYDHSKARAIGGMISKAVEYAMGRGDVNNTDLLSENSIFNMNDSQLMSALSNYKYSKQIVANIQLRNTPKLAGFAKRSDVEKEAEAYNAATKMTAEQRQETEDKIARKLGVPPYLVILDIPNTARYVVKEADIPISSGRQIVGKLRDTAISRLADPIVRQHEFLWAVRLYCPRGKEKQARDEFEKITKIQLAVRKPPLLKTDFWRLRNIFE